MAFQFEWHHTEVALPTALLKACCISVYFLTGIKENIFTDKATLSRLRSVFLTTSVGKLQKHPYVLRKRTEIFFIPRWVSATLLRRRSAQWSLMWLHVTTFLCWFWSPFPIQSWSGTILYNASDGFLLCHGNDHSPQSLT